MVLPDTIMVLPDTGRRYTIDAVRTASHAAVAVGVTYEVAFAHPLLVLAPHIIR